MNTNKKEPKNKINVTLSVQHDALIIFVLIVIIIMLFLTPILFWSNPIPVILWAIILISSIMILGIFLTHQFATRMKTSFQTELLSLQKENNNLKLENESHNKKVSVLTNQHRAEIKQKDSSLASLTEEIRILKAENNSLVKYKTRLKELYLSSSLEDTRHYASEIFKHEDFLQLYEPIKYAKNPIYAQIIDLHANELSEILSLPNPDLFSQSNTSKIQMRINELLKNNKNGSNGDTSPVYTHDRQTLKRIDKGVEI